MCFIQLPDIDPRAATHGMSDGWWRAMFDDVMEDVLARGVIGDEADGDRVRGAVGVII